MTPEQALKNSNIYACVSILADDLGKLPIHTFKKQDMRRGMQHPAARLLYDRPNPFMTAFTFKQTLEMHVGLYGNGYAHIEWGTDGYPRALWPLDPVNTTVDLNTAAGKLEYHTQDAAGKQYTFGAADVLHFKTMSRDGYVGTPPWKTLLDELSSQNAIKKFIDDFYKNGTLASGVLQTASKMNKEAKQAMREEWKRLNGGMDNAGEIAVLDVGLDYKQLGMQLDQAQFLETQKFGINEVAKVYRIPPHKLAQLDRATYANAEAMGLDYIKTTLLPIFTQWEQEINYKLFTEKERASFYVKFNAAAELRGDSTARAQYYQTMVTNGVYTLNEVREMEELTGIGELGDTHFVSKNYATLENICAEASEPAKGGEGDGEKRTAMSQNPQRNSDDG
ncbi:portal protein, HK97 family [Megasphaera vaginalis (ex Srinivasan et al. 2021)]|uniref:Portal protein, HK97 family n=2 Tax=Megasphaera vaginalis (ex Srinivasan et al. 2021) TaxID=1111454 RepID=U7UV75_9FIRM|nr:portal protein, HK97 family [Megasphaera vaginalis (ex Srinivasan et al. 2021)]